ncbi:MAG: histidinol-phosphate aminotransferase family protein [Caldisphaeraceae archaeon]|nr:histidinol-phosphate aminotransferase family protein [Caldisphaeraceae archaeon]
MIDRIHGGSPSRNFIDFSAPSNPLGPPTPSEGLLKECIKSHSYTSYPSYERLLTSLSEYWKIGREYIVPVNGSAEALSLIPLILRSDNIIILEPNFGDHEIMASALGIRLVRPTIKLVENRQYVNIDDIIKATRTPGKNLLILSRPNNPTGFCINKREVEEIASSVNAHIIIDEAFIEISDCEPMKPTESYILLRSQTKVFSTHGLRLGEIITMDKKFLKEFSSSMQAWPIDSITNCFYSKILMMKDIREYIKRARELLKKERDFIKGKISSKVNVFDSKTAFFLIRHDSLPNPSFKQKLMEVGIYIRDASSFFGLNRNYSRISIRNHEDNKKLVESINGVIDND